MEATAPWTLAKAERTGAGPERLDAVLAELVATCRAIAEYLTPFLPSATARIAAQAGDGGPTVAAPTPVFPRLEIPA